MFSDFCLRNIGHRQTRNHNSWGSAKKLRVQQAAWLAQTFLRIPRGRWRVSENNLFMRFPIEIRETLA